ncbi:Vacuolar import and degradation protein 27 [Golovinomyces cichoracearum]|uniref:Vacuolar import and degradation protein 27 n=1 Tax=Golovinomyces cichoracearum TaxID=62708 RepID=A0A420INX2_9PEZI|nr:Vacuolar import and degradation protein 27 [Golovinomyces cichoracearum]
MFMLRNVGKLIFGDTSREFLVELSQGQLYLVRPSSPKSFSELIFKDAAARIQRTSQEYQYQLVIQRVYEEGEADLGEEEESGDAEITDLAAERDQKIFLLDKSLKFCSEIRQNGDKILIWRDLSGDNGDIYQFVCDYSIDTDQVLKFETVAQNCQYEREYRKKHSTATKQDLAKFCFKSEYITPSTGSIQNSSNSSPSNIQKSSFSDETSVSMPRNRDSEIRSSISKSSDDSEVSLKPTESIRIPDSIDNPKAISILCKETAELHLFDIQSGAFILQDSKVEATVSEVGQWKYWLEISSKEREWVGQAVIADINPVFNFEFLSFIFNAYTTNGDAYSWLLRFQDTDILTRFQEGLMQALWEQLNEIRWKNSKASDRDYVTEAFQDLAMEDAHEEDEEEEYNEDIRRSEEESEEEDEDAQRSEHYDTDEEDDNVNSKPNDGNENSLLAVGYKNDRSFVVRGSKIGVFKHTSNNNLEFTTNIARVETPSGKLFSPKKIMLHEEDSNLILQNDTDPHSLYRMDLEYGKIVDEWTVHPDIEVETFTPENKFAQMSSEKTFIGISQNALFRIDPRLAGNKLVDSELKQYISKNKFSAATTTEKGYIAVASNKGDIRMFDRLGINAKTLIPALGEPIIGLDVSADGRWILATCRTCLLLIDVLQKQGKNEGKLGFEKSFSKDSKPQPRRLGLTPSHVAQFNHETGSPISFRTAHFNTGEGHDETSIISATGPFVVTWSMKKVLNGVKEPYTIKRYTEEVKADNFKYGSDKNVIVTLPNEVNMVAKTALRKPTRESIMTPSRISGGSFGGRRSISARFKLGKDDIVNSPY